MMRAIYIAGVCWSLARGDLLGVLLCGLALEYAESRRLATPPEARSRP